MFKWIDTHKNDNKFWVNLLKTLYSLGKIEVVHSIVVTLLGLLIPFLFDIGQFWWAIVCIVFLILSIIFNYVCSKYQKHQYKQRELAAKVLENQSSLINTLNIELKSNQQWKATVFKKISEIVCEKIQHIFKDILQCNTRVSIEYVFNKKDLNKVEKFVKMSGRRSPNRDTCKKSILLNKRSKYYSYKLFTDNKIGINILSEDQIKQKTLWYKNPSHETDVKKYIGIAVSVQDDEHVDYILQIDCLDEIVFGKNDTNEEIALFINQYLKAYINVVSLSYSLNLNKNKQIPEV